MTEDDAEAQAEQFYRARLLGLAPRLIAERFAISVQDVNKIVDEKMPRVTNEYRARAFALDLERLETLTARCLEQVSKRSMAAGHLLLKTLERRSAMLGTDATIRIDPLEVIGPRETSTGELLRIFNEIRQEHEQAAEASERPVRLPG